MTEREGWREGMQGRRSDDGSEQLRKGPDFKSDSNKVIGWQGSQQKPPQLADRLS